MSPILEVKDLQTSYGTVNVLAGVSFTVEQGETYAMVGESGVRQNNGYSCHRGAGPCAGGIGKI